MSEGAARVLEALREAGGRPCSGGALAEGLGVSRAQVWKHVELLRRRGYEIEGTPGRRLPARRRRPIGSTPRRSRPGSRRAGSRGEIEWLDVTDSTNRVAAERARAGARHGTAVIAEGQTAGRGRLGRSLLLAALPEPLHLDRAAPGLSLAEAPTAILAAGVAVAETVAETVGDPARGRGQVAERRAPRRAQDLGHPDGARRRGDAGRPPRARDRRQPERPARGVPRGVPRPRATSLAATSAGRWRARISRAACSVPSKTCWTSTPSAASRRCGRASTASTGWPDARWWCSEPGGAAPRGRRPRGPTPTARSRCAASDGTRGARAGRRRDPRAPRRSAARERRVLLAVDVGNTNVLFGLFDYAGGEGAALAALAHRDAPRADLRRARRPGARALRAARALDRARSTDVILSTVVPPLLPDLGARLRQALRAPAARRRPGHPHRHADPLREPARGRRRPHRERRGGRRADGRPRDRRRLRHRHHLRLRLGPRRVPRRRDLPGHPRGDGGALRPRLDAPPHRDRAAAHRDRPHHDPVAPVGPALRLRGHGGRHGGAHPRRARRRGAGRRDRRPRAAHRQRDAVASSASSPSSPSRACACSSRRTAPSGRSPRKEK